MAGELYAAAPDQLLEVAHVAHRLGYSQDYVRQLIHDHKLKAIRFGRRWRIDPADLKVYIDRHRTPDVPERRRTSAPALFPLAVMS